MQLSIDFWQWLAIQGAMLTFFFGALAGLARLVLRQFEARIDARLDVADNARSHAVVQSEERFAALERELREIHRAQGGAREEMLRDYVRREDSIRDQTVTSAKLDALASEIKLLAQYVARLQGPQ